ncbi:MAG TPA: protein kinase [Gemmatimonadales bacterium]|nr:protein kinase [Gemmatimonadales bacterium]
MAEPFASLKAALAGHYQVERELGHGGMATVYLAQDLKNHRPVALKVLRPELAAALGPERFLREVRITARLNHPHILPLLDSGEARGFLYYVMPYVEGESLRDRLGREMQLPLQDALQIAREVADALAYAHTHDVVHRDIKPENILLESGHAVVADFGIARAITVAGGDKLTQTGVAVGTPAYMSPEQALGEEQVDGRSDVYSLACVLYEVLAGEPPFKGPTAQAILARRLNDPVPSLHTVRETVPAEIERAITKALAKVPADRFATAEQFIEALGQPATKLRGVSWRVVRWAALGAMTVAAAAALLVLRFSSAGRVTLDPNLIVVAPFDVRAAGLGLWSEGLVEYLSRSLDGAGELRTVSPSVFLRSWRGPADPASARDLGRRTGARLVVFGSLVQGALDSVRLRATLFDAAGDRPQGEVEVRGDTLAIDRVADSLAVSLLRELGRTRPVAAVRNAPFSAAPLPALKEFLRGEQFYRRGQYDSALTHHARAVSLDTTFALAYKRMSQDIGWGAAPTSGAFESADAYAFKAARFNRGLTMRDSLLIAADSCLRAAAEGSLTDWVAVNQRQFTVVNEAARRFPDDPEVWMALGEASYHHLLHAGYQHPVYVGFTGYHGGGSPFESLGTPAEVLQAFETAIRLDPGFRPAYGHIVDLTMQTGQADLARQYARAYLALNVTERSVTTLTLALLLDTARSARPELSRLIDTIAVGPLFGAAYDLRTWPDSGETAIRLLRALPRGHRSVAGSWPPYWVDTLIWPQSLATFLLYRGRAGEAYEVYRPLLSRPNPHSWAVWFWNPLRDLALLGAIPADTASAAIARSLRPEGIPQRNWLPWWFARRDTIALERMIAQADRAARHTTNALERLLARYFRAAAAGYLVLLQGDSGSALRDFDALPDTACVWVDCSLEKLTLARLLAARGDDRRAGEVLDRWLWIDPSPFFVIARLERARIAEQLGDRDTAIRWYQFVVAAWRHADPELQHQVAEARGGLRRLGAEPPR